MLTTTLYVDFGDAFPGGALNTTLAQFNTLFGALPSNMGGNLPNQVGGVNTIVNVNSFGTEMANRGLTPAQTTTARAEIMQMVREDFAPFDITVVELTANNQTVTDSQNTAFSYQVSGIANYGQAAGILAANNFPALTAFQNDAYLLLGGITATNANSPGLGVNPNNFGRANSLAEILGNTNNTDDSAYVNVANIFAARPGVQNFSVQTANTTSHEAGHTYGLRHLQTGLQVNMSEQMSQFANVNQSFFTRGFGLRTVPGEFPGSPPQDPFQLLANFNGLSSIGYASGTGLADVITITDVGGNQANVTVTNAFTAATGTVVNYNVDMTDGIRIESGVGNDIVNVGPGVNVNFIDLHNGNDTLTIADGAFVSGNIFGGNGNDTINIGNVTVTGTVNGDAQFLSNGNFNDTIVHNGGIWTIDGINSGNVNGFNFVNTENVQGGGQSETFNFVNGGFVTTATGLGGNDSFVFSGNGAAARINGGFGIDTFDYSSSTVLSNFWALNNVDGFGFDGAAAGFSFVDVDVITGSATASDTLVGLNQGAIWQLNQVTYSTGGQVLTVNNFDVLNGGNGTDVFNVLAMNQPFTLNGGGGNDIVTLSSVAGSSAIGNLNGIVGQLTYNGGTGADVLNMTDINGSPNSVSIFSGQIAGMTALPVIYRSVSTINLFGSNVGNDTFNVRSFLGGNTLNINSGNGADSFFVAAAPLGTMNLNGGSGNDNYTVNLSGAARTINVNEAAGAGSDSGTLFATAGNDVLSVGAITNGVSVGMGAETVNVRRVESVALNALAGNDTFNMGAGNPAITLIGGAGTDTVNGPNANRTWNLTNQFAGNISGATFFNTVETIRPGTAVDTINVGNPAIGITVADQGGIDTINGPNRARTWTLTGANAGNLNVSNLTWTGIENLTGGSALDTFVFANNAATVRAINGGTGSARDHMNYAARSNTVVTALTGVSANGFNGTSTGITAGFTNIWNITAGSASNDQITGRNTAATWRYAPAGSRYTNGASTLTFTNFERLIGGTAVDSFIVTPSPTSTLFINGGAPNTAPGDNLRINFAGAVNPNWNFTGVGTGNFTFANRARVNYAGIEALNNFDFGDAANSFGTLLSANGARHRLSALTAPVFLGAARPGGGVGAVGLDPETNGQPGGTALRDDNNGSFDDENGVILPPVLIPHFRAAALVTASATAKLDAWIDFDGSGTFTSNEKIANNLVIAGGTTRLEFTVPLNAAANVATSARFRLSPVGSPAVGPTGAVTNGEVEDYSLGVRRPAPGQIGVYPDPFKPGQANQQILIMAGTGGNDNMAVGPTVNDGLKVKINGTTFRQTSSQIQRVGGFGLGGNDDIILASNTTQQAEIYGDDGADGIYGGASADYLLGGNGPDNMHGNGGNDFMYGNAGNDKVIGNGGNDVLSGNSGNDLLYGHSGIDILLGGTGSDILWGQSGGDLLVGNRSSFDANTTTPSVSTATNEAALTRILNEWTSARSYNMRVNNVNNGTGPVLGGTGTQLRTGVTVFNDGAEDTLFGGEDTDAFFSVFGNDDIRDLDAGELIR